MACGNILFPLIFQHQYKETLTMFFRLDMYLFCVKRSNAIQLIINSTFFVTFGKDQAVFQRTFNFFSLSVLGLNCTIYSCAKSWGDCKAEIQSCFAVAADK